MFSYRLSIFVITLLVALLLAACGGGTSSEPQTGTVGIVITDYPSAEFAEINLTVSGVELRGEDTQAVLFDADSDGGPRKVNLLSLTDYADLFVMSEAEVGDYTKVRLYVDEIELVPHNDQLPAIYPKIPANGKVDLNPRRTFTVLPGDVLYLHIDIDANKSIHTHPTGNGEYRFRPVVFVDVISEAFAGKLVRIYGYAQDIDVDAENFRLCRLNSPFVAELEGEPDAGDGEQEYCIAVDAAAASVFDEDGLPVALGDVLEEDSLLTAIGFIDVLPSTSNGATQTVTAVSHDDDEHYSRVLLRAEVIEMGPAGSFATIDGTVAQAPDDQDLFVLTLDDMSDLGVQLQEGTKIFSKSGEALTAEALAPESAVRVDGVLDPATGHLLASLVIVDRTPPSAIALLSGTVVMVDEDNERVIVSTDAGQSVVLIGTETLVFGIDADAADGALSDTVDYTDLVPGQRVDVYGTPTASGFEATVVLALQPVAVPL